MGLIKQDTWSLDYSSLQKRPSNSDVRNLGLSFFGSEPLTTQNFPVIVGWKVSKFKFEASESSDFNLDLKQSLSFFDCSCISSVLGNLTTKSTAAFKVASDP